MARHAPETSPLTAPQRRGSRRAQPPRRRPRRATTHSDAPGAGDGGKFNRWEGAGGVMGCSIGRVNGRGHPRTTGWAPLAAPPQQRRAAVVHHEGDSRGAGAQAWARRCSCRWLGESLRCALLWSCCAEPRPKGRTCTTAGLLGRLSSLRSSCSYPCRCLPMYGSSGCSFMVSSTTTRSASAATICSALPGTRHGVCVCGGGVGGGGGVQGPPGGVGPRCGGGVRLGG